MAAPLSKDTHSTSMCVHACERACVLIHNTVFSSPRYAALACCVTNQQPEGAQLKPKTMGYVLTSRRKLRGSGSRACVCAADKFADAAGIVLLYIG